MTGSVRPTCTRLGRCWLHGKSSSTWHPAGRGPPPEYDTQQRSGEKCRSQQKVFLCFGSYTRTRSLHDAHSSSVSLSLLGVSYLQSGWSLLKFPMWLSPPRAHLVVCRRWQCYSLLSSPHHSGWSIVVVRHLRDISHIQLIAMFGMKCVANELDPSKPAYSQSRSHKCNVMSSAKFKYRVTCIIVNDFESENLYFVNS